MPRRQSRQVWRTLDFQATTSAPQVSEPFQEDEVIIIGAEAVMPTPMPIIVDAVPFEPEVIIQTETIDLSQEQRDHYLNDLDKLRVRHERAQEHNDGNFAAYQKVMGKYMEHVMKSASYNDQVMTVCGVQLMNCDKADPPYITILISKDRILSEEQTDKEIPYKMRSMNQSLLVVCASVNREAAMCSPERITSDYSLMMKTEEFICLPHALKQRIYDPLNWMWIHELDHKSSKEYFTRPFTAMAVADHFETITSNNGEVALGAKVAAAAIKKTMPTPHLLDQWKWEEAKNGLFKDLGVKPQKHKKYMEDVIRRGMGEAPGVIG
tara:strand:- start:2153 stop:3121 length:969 start_codon:yes stop_codon:yes gene_type:complete